MDGVALSVEAHAPVVVGIYPMRIARFVLDQAAGSNGTGFHAHAHGGLHLAEPHEVEPADVTGE